MIYANQALRAALDAMKRDALRALRTGEAAALEKRITARGRTRRSACRT